MRLHAVVDGSSRAIARRATFVIRSFLIGIGLHVRVEWLVGGVARDHATTVLAHILYDSNLVVFVLVDEL